MTSPQRRNSTNPYQPIGRDPSMPPRKKPRVTLIYASRDKDKILLKDELEFIQRKAGDNLDIWYYVGNKESEVVNRVNKNRWWEWIFGLKQDPEDDRMQIMKERRFNFLDLKNLVGMKGERQGRTKIFVCGPDG
jgi:ferredoxin-NADP reductase